MPALSLRHDRDTDNPFFGLQALGETFLVMSAIAHLILPVTLQVNARWQGLTENKSQEVSLGTKTPSSLPSALGQTGAMQMWVLRKGPAPWTQNRLHIPQDKGQRFKG